MTKPTRSLERVSDAFEDLSYRVNQDRKKALRVIRLIQETQIDPFGGIGKPEPLGGDVAGCGRNALTAAFLCRIIDGNKPRPLHLAFGRAFYFVAPFL